MGRAFSDGWRVALVCLGALGALAVGLLRLGGAPGPEAADTAGRAEPHPSARPQLDGAGGQAATRPPQSSGVLVTVKGDHGEPISDAIVVAAGPGVGRGVSSKGETDAAGRARLSADALVGAYCDIDVSAAGLARHQQRTWLARELEIVLHRGCEVVVVPTKGGRFPVGDALSYRVGERVASALVEDPLRVTLGRLAAPAVEILGFGRCAAQHPVLVPLPDVGDVEIPFPCGTDQLAHIVFEPGDVQLTDDAQLALTSPSSPVGRYVLAPTGPEFRAELSAGRYLYTVVAGQSYAVGGFEVAAGTDLLRVPIPWAPTCVLNVRTPRERAMREVRAFLIDSKRVDLADTPLFKGRVVALDERAALGIASAPDPQQAFPPGQEVVSRFVVRGSSASWRTCPRGVVLGVEVAFEDGVVQRVRADVPLQEDERTVEVPALPTCEIVLTGGGESSALDQVVVEVSRLGGSESAGTDRPIRVMPVSGRCLVLGLEEAVRMRAQARGPGRALLGNIEFEARDGVRVGLHVSADIRQGLGRRGVALVSEAGHPVGGVTVEFRPWNGMSQFARSDERGVAALDMPLTEEVRAIVRQSGLTADPAVVPSTGLARLVVSRTYSLRLSADSDRPAALVELYRGSRRLSRQVVVARAGAVLVFAGLASDEYVVAVSDEAGGARRESFVIRDGDVRGRLP